MLILESEYDNFMTQLNEAAFLSKK